MASILDHIMARKLQEVEQARQRSPLPELQAQSRDRAPPRDFVNAIRRDPGVSLIAEIKRSSPSRGVIRADFEPASIARIFSDHGATCLSVLTDESFFGGHLSFLQQVRDAVALPILRKDFIIDAYQVWEAVCAGADAVLLIAECLTPGKLRELHDLILSLGLTPLVELYQPENLETVLSCQPVLVGVNNRDLHTFDMDLDRSLRLRAMIPRDILFVSESGIEAPEDVGRLAAAHVDAMLVGESLMKQTDIGEAVRRLLGPAK